MSLAGRLLLVLLALAWTTVVGWALTRFFARGLSRGEMLSWSFATGLFVQACLFAALLALRMIPGPRKLGALGVLIVAASLALRRPARSGLPIRPLARPRLLVLLVPAAALLAVSALDVLAQPVWATDAVAIWLLKAKTIFLTGSVPRRLFTDPAMLWSHPEYPLFVPLSFASVAAFTRAFDDQALALVDVALEVATVLAVYGFLTRRVSLVAGVAAALLAESCFFLYRGANAGTAEVPFALAAVLLSTALLDVEDRTDRNAGTRLFAAAVLCVTTKQEGVLLVILAFASMAIRSLRDRRPAPLRTAAVSLLPPAAAQIVLTRVLASATGHRDYDVGLLAPLRLPEWTPRLAAIVSHLTRVEIRGSLAALAALVLFFVVTRRTPVDRLLPTLVLQVCAYAVAASLSSWGAIWSLETSFARITMTLFPAFTLVLGARMGATEAKASPRLAV